MLQHGSSPPPYSFSRTVDKQWLTLASLNVHNQEKQQVKTQDYIVIRIYNQYVYTKLIYVYS